MRPFLFASRSLNVSSCLHFSRRLSVDRGTSKVHASYRTYFSIIFGSNILIDYETAPTRKQVSNSAEQSSSSEADSCSVGQKMFSLLWNPTVHCHIHSSPPTDPTPSHTRQIQTLAF